MKYKKYMTDYHYGAYYRSCFIGGNSCSCGVDNDVLFYTHDILLFKKSTKKDWKGIYNTFYNGWRRSFED